MRYHFFTISLLLISTLLFVPQAKAQLNSSQIKAGLQKLDVVGSVLYIAAHPDDENTRLLAWLANERKLRTGYLSLTRGDGGQNLIGTEQSEELGLIRTQELLAARRIDGAEQFFTPANDFGFSKTHEETFKHWNKERILGDVVWVIRKFKPDVIITRFPGDSRAGHGQHAASSILAQEAFKAAADPSRFPEQLKSVEPWQAKRIFWNTFNFGSNNTTSESQLKVNVGLYNPLLGKDYNEIAAESRSQHKSQGFGVAPQRGDMTEYFSLLGGDPAKSDLFEGIDTKWSRLKGNEKTSELIQKVNKDFNPDRPQDLVPHLLKLRSQFVNIKDTYWRTQKLKDLDELILATAGIWFEAVAAEPTYAVGEKVTVKVNAISRFTSQEIKVNSVGASPELSLNLEPNRLKTANTELNATLISQPYWLEEQHPIGEYKLKNIQQVGYPENPDGLKVKFNLVVGGTPISIEKPVLYKHTDPVRGELYQSLQIAPPVTATLQTQELLFTSNTPQSLQISLKAFRNNASGILSPTAPSGWRVEPQSIQFNLKNKGDEQTISFKVSPVGSAASGSLKAKVEMDNQVYEKSLKTISYTHIPLITYFPEAEANLIKLDLKTAGKKLGYLMGAGDKVPEALRLAGFDVTLLNETAVMNTDLKVFDAIITGVRLYNVDQRMKFINNRLLQYVENGGVLLVQYNVSQPLVTNAIGPYPFSITRERVTEEDAKVKILNPSHPIFNYPNKITHVDFDGWIQERGLYFVNDPDKKYQALLEMNDTNESPRQGSLIVTDYGKGRYVYTGLSFFRQLPAGVPGAYRLFVNLITKPKK